MAIWLLVFVLIDILLLLLNISIFFAQKMDFCQVLSLLYLLSLDNNVNMVAFETVLML